VEEKERKLLVEMKRAAASDKTSFNLSERRFLSLKFLAPSRANLKVHKDVALNSQCFLNITIFITVNRIFF
jgi:hypothetical protein